MNIAVRYYTKSGNTMKLAYAIASEVGVQAETVDKGINEVTDILFLGSSVYAAGVDEAIKKFINTLDPGKVKKVVCFSTAALLPSTYKQVKALLENKGIAVDANEYHCRGSFGIMHKNKPDDKNLSEVRAFAKNILNK